MCFECIYKGGSFEPPFEHPQDNYGYIVSSSVCQRTNTPVGIIRIVIDDTVHYQRTKLLIKSIVSNKDGWRLCVSIKFICMK